MLPRGIRISQEASPPCIPKRVFEAEFGLCGNRTICYISHIVVRFVAHVKFWHPAPALPTAITAMLTRSQKWLINRHNAG
jgi:hypothetical protein